MSESKTAKKMDWLSILLTIIVMLFVVFSGLWYESNWASMRDFTQRAYTSTTDWEGVNSQYDTMAAAFASGTTTFTFQIASLDIPVTSSQFSTTDKAGAISYVLDQYTNELINNDQLTGKKAGIHLVAGATVHTIYLIASVISGLMLLLVAGYMLAKSSLAGFVQRSGLKVLIAGIVLLAGLYVVYAVFVDGWIASDNAVYNEGLPIIAAALKEFFTCYIIGVIVLGIVLTALAYVGPLAKGKLPGDKPTK